MQNEKTASTLVDPRLAVTQITRNDLAELLVEQEIARLRADLEHATATARAANAALAAARTAYIEGVERQVKAEHRERVNTLVHALAHVTGGGASQEWHYDFRGSCADYNLRHNTGPGPILLALPDALRVMWSERDAILIHVNLRGRGVIGRVAVRITGQHNLPDRIPVTFEIAIDVPEAEFPALTEEEHALIAAARAAVHVVDELQGKLVHYRSEHGLREARAALTARALDYAGIADVRLADLLRLPMAPGYNAVGKEGG
jgi:hypothetical protein